jgi:hypothetical protein
MLAISALAGGCNSSPGQEATASTGGSAAVTWSVPTQNTDGTALTDLSGYRIFYGTSPSALTRSVDVSGSATTSRTVTGLGQGTYYFAVAAVNAAGVASDVSNAVSMTVQ